MPVWDTGKECRTGSDAAATDQDLDYLFSEKTFKNRMGLILGIQLPLNLKWIRPVDKGGKFY